MARVYLDWNATTPPLPEVLDAMHEAGRSTWANPSSIHTDGRAARAVVEDARAAVAELTGFDARSILFTSGGTEANNVAIRSAFRADASREGQPPWLVTSHLEHPSVTRVAEALEREGRARVRWIRVRPNGVLDLADLERALGEAENVALVTIQAVNHETGVVQPVTDAIALSHAKGARVHVDAVQAWGKIDTTALANADSASLAGHKIRGPKGIGALVTRPGLALSPLLVGGAQERGLRPGTVDPSLAAGLAVAARRAVGVYMQYTSICARRDTLESSLLARPIASDRAPRVVGAGAPRAPHVSTLVWPGWVGAELVAALDLEGVSVSSGAACSAGTIEPSPVLRAMLGERDAASGVRASLGPDTTDDDIRRAIDAFRRVMARVAIPSGAR